MRPRLRHGLYLRLVLSIASGLAAGIWIPFPADTDRIVRVLVGFIVAALVLDLPLLALILRLGPQDTARYLRGQTHTRWVVEFIVVAAAIASLGGVATMLLASGAQDQTDKVIEAFLTMATVAAAWLSVHTLYTMRYGRHYYVTEPGCVDFEAVTEPRFSDFAYLAFTLGMTYQVSDTDLKTARLRRIVLFHTLLSYLFGTVIVAATINLVAGLAK
jgi:uncharacterized membrane protein